MLGYKFAGAGPCQIPVGKTAHLLYRPISGGNITTFTVSLFVQADTGQLPIDSGKVYFAEDKIYNTPMIICRRGWGVLTSWWAKITINSPMPPGKLG